VADRAADDRSYASGARILSLGIAATGLLTFAFFAIASHVLGAVSAKRIDLLWSVMFVVISVIYRPVEQLLSRTIADRRARGLPGERLRVPVTIQSAFAAAFLAVVLPLHDTLTKHVFDGYGALYWVLVVGILAYGASYFARGWLAGHKYFGLYGGLVLMEATSRVAFALAVALSILHGETAVALGIAAAPFVSLIVVPVAFVRHGARVGGPRANLADAAIEGPAAEGVEEVLTGEAPHPSSLVSLRHGGGFALSVSGIQLAEQALLNAGVLTVDATSANRALAGIVFNVLLITRAPLQLFQAIQTSLLPHLAGLEATAGREAFARAIRVTVLAIGAFAASVAIALLALGPFAMRHLFGQHYSYDRFGLALIALGMGLHLISGALNQAALARSQARAAAAAWLGAAALFVAWTSLTLIGDAVLRVELGYFLAAALLAAVLAWVYRRGSPTASASSA
jgi:O-antigen/teichoic acid export membrane protein